MTRTVEELLIEAYNVQDACNLSGVVHSFSRAMTELRENGINATSILNTHPVCVLYADKIRQLTECDFDSLNVAYKQVFDLKEAIEQRR